MRILVIEDESALRESLKTQLVAAGFTVDVAQDGKEGLFAGLEYPLDVAVIDLGLPQVSGLEVIRKLRAAHKTYPILILTARDNWQDKVEGLQAGADDYVSVDGAPVELTTFEYRILEHLMLRAGEVISKAELTERLYDQDFERDSNVIEVLVWRLRRKLDPQDRLKPIETLRGRGYRFSLARQGG